jgi:hypothetical protein
MKAGDSVRVTWPDGDIATGIFLREERGFFVFQDSSGKQFVCAKGHTDIEKVDEKG